MGLLPLQNIPRIPMQGRWIHSTASWERGCALGRPMREYEGEEGIVLLVGRRPRLDSLQHTTYPRSDTSGRTMGSWHCQRNSPRTSCAL